MRSLLTLLLGLAIGLGVVFIPIGILGFFSSDLATILFKYGVLNNFEFLIVGILLIAVGLLGLRWSKSSNSTGDANG